MFLVKISFTALCLAILIWGLQWSGLDSSTALHQWATQEHNLLLIVCVSVLLMIISAMTPLPAEAVTLANGMIFGPLLGAAITWISAMLGAYIAFVWSRHFLSNVNSKTLNKDKWRKINRWMDKWGACGFLFARLIPAIPFFALNIGAAFLPLSNKSYLLITGLAILPHVLLICFFGGFMLEN